MRSPECSLLPASGQRSLALCCAPSIAILLFLLTFTQPASAERRIPQTPLEGPSLQEILQDLQKPLPPIEEPDPKFVHALRKPPVLFEEESRPRTAHGIPVIWCLVLLLLGWYLHAGLAVTRRQWAFASAAFFAHPQDASGKRWSVAATLRHSVI